MQQMFMMRFAAGGISGCLLGFLLVGLVYFAPRHVPKLYEEFPRKMIVANGVQQKTDLFGLVEMQWEVRNGEVNGDVLQYYPSGALYREVTYQDGKLHGLVREYHEKKGYRRRPPEGKIVSPQVRVAMAGPQLRVMSYSYGQKNGPYEIYYESGILKEQGKYIDGNLAGKRRKFSKDGEVREEKYFKEF